MSPAPTITVWTLLASPHFSSNIKEAPDRNLLKVLWEESPGLGQSTSGEAALGGSSFWLRPVPRSKYMSFIPGGVRHGSDETRTGNSIVLPQSQG